MSALQSMLEKIARPLQRRAERRRIHAAPFYRVYPYRHALDIASCDRRGAVDVERSFFFNRVPKAANTTVSVALAGAKLGRTPAANEAKAAFLRPSQLTTAQVAAFEGFFKFTIVRNPYARALSGYLNKIVGGKKLKYLGRTAGAGPPPSFFEFCSYLERGGLHANAHWAPQTSLLLVPLEELDFIGRVETLNADLPRILARIGVGSAEPHGERGPRRTRAESGLASHYDERCAEIVRRLYRSDFEAFGYSPRLEDVLQAG